MSKRYYSGVGSRETPPEIQKTMTKIAKWLSSAGYILRSGHADGADMAFELGAMGDSEIYLPWSGFNKQYNMQLDKALGVYQVPKFTKKHEEILSDVHPLAASLSRGAKSLHMRNINQVYGKDVENPVFSDFVLCWTSCGAESYRECFRATGGTGTAIKLASLKMIPVFNLKNDDAIERFKQFLKKQQ